MISKLKYKATVSIRSLIEGRKTDEIVIKMWKQFNFETLKRNLTDIYLQFQNLSNGEYLQHIFQNHRISKITPVNQDQASFIIQTGFNLFILYQTFVDAQVLPANKV